MKLCLKQGMMGASVALRKAVLPGKGVWLYHVLLSILLTCGLPAWMM